MSTVEIQQQRALELPATLVGGPGWLHRIRQSSLEVHNSTPLPRRGLHLWRYTDPSRFVVDDVDPAEIVFGSDQAAIDDEMVGQIAAGYLDGAAVDLGGRRICHHASQRLTAMGGVVAPLSAALKSHEDLVKKHLYGLVHEQIGVFEALNGALWEDGVFVYIPSDTIIEKPIHLRREAGAGRSRQFFRLLVIAGENSDVSIIDEYNGGPDDISESGYSNSGVEIFAGHGSKIRYVPIGRQASGMTSYLTHRARLGRDAVMQTIPLAFGAALSKQNFGVLLSGPGARSEIYGLVFGSGRQRFDNHTLHHHISGQTGSNIDFKVVLRDRTESAYTGLIRIEHGAPGCEAYQENRNLLLNPGAKVETIPELEILNEDVMCTHGATVGSFDDEMVFYLTSRGLSYSDAVRAIVSGFVASTLKMVPENLHERIEAFVEKRLEGI